MMYGESAPTSSANKWCTVIGNVFAPFTTTFSFVVNCDFWFSIREHYTPIKRYSRRYSIFCCQLHHTFDLGCLCGEEGAGKVCCGENVKKHLGVMTQTWRFLIFWFVELFRRVVMNKSISVRWRSFCSLVALNVSIKWVHNAFSEDQQQTVPKYVRFEGFMTATMKNGVFWNIKPHFVPHRGHITSPLPGPAS
jgi:hypothetical protein